MVNVSADVLAVAVDLIGSQAEREGRAFDRGRLIGFTDDWRCGLAAGLERGAA
jgi:hypothetical protein